VDFPYIQFRRFKRTYFPPNKDKKKRKKGTGKYGLQPCTRLKVSSSGLRGRILASFHSYPVCENNFPPAAIGFER